MPKNLEIKIQINSFNELRKKLEYNRIPLKKILIQKDIYYSVESGLLKLRIENGEKSLIFYNRDENASKRLSDYNVIELKNGKVEKFLRLFLNQDIAVSKVRELYLYNNTRIHLDKVKGLGSFIELETLVLEGLKDAENRFNKMLKSLNLDVDKQIKASYRDLLLKKKNDTYKIKNK